MPVAGSQTPATWHWSRAVQTPAWQVSVWVQASLSSQAVPSAAVGSEQMPVAGSQTPATWHWSRAVQTTGVPGSHVNVPRLHTSMPLHASPSLQSASVTHVVCAKATEPIISDAAMSRPAIMRVLTMRRLRIPPDEPRVATSRSRSPCFGGTAERIVCRHVMRLLGVRHGSLSCQDNSRLCSLARKSLYGALCDD